MIADEQSLLSVQPFQDRLRLFTAEEHIADDANGVAARNAAVPVSDHRFIHFFDRLKRAVAEMKNVLVTEVSIGNKEKHKGALLFYPEP